jgi:dTDP-glucose pyrophosphorylase
MRGTIESLLINRDMTVGDAIRVIDEGECKTAFLTEDGVLLGVVTDGDVRRHLIGGGDIKENVSSIVNFNPRFVYESEAENCQQLMYDAFLTAIPVVDENKRIIRVETLRKRQQFSQRIDENIPVVMMAGGKGARLKPYTDIIPKPLIPIGDKTITEHIFDKFVSHGCNEFYMVLNYKRSLIEAYFHDIEKYEKLSFVEEPYFMGTAGGMGLLRDVIKKNFFLVNCDILVDYDYYSIWRRHVEMENIVTIVSAQKRISVPYGTIVADSGGKVQKLTEKPQLLYNVNTGMYLCNEGIFRYMNKGEKVDMPDLIQRCIDAGENVGQVSIDEQDWYDMGQPKELEMMKKRFNLT